jgi:hypothetical protein
MTIAKPENLDWHESALIQPAVPRPRWKPKYRMALLWIAIAGIAADWLVCEVLLGWFLFFSPGWANGWPRPLTYQLVLATGLTVYRALQLITAAAGANALVGLILALVGFVRGEKSRCT